MIGGDDITVVIIQRSEVVVRIIGKVVICGGSKRGCVKGVKSGNGLSILAEAAACPSDSGESALL